LGYVSVCVILHSDALVLHTVSPFIIFILPCGNWSKGLMLDYLLRAQYSWTDCQK
jgi:hypothetical protein